MKGFFKRICSLLCAGVLLVTSLGTLAVTAETDYSEYYTQIIERWENTIIGSEELDLTDEIISAKVDSITATAKKYWDTMTRPETENPAKEDYFNLWLNNSRVFSTSGGHSLSGYIWADKAADPIKQSSVDSGRAQTAAFTTNFNRIRAMALAYRIGDETLKGNEKFLEETMYALEFLTTYWYADSTNEYGNWWDWNIGIPLAINDIAVLLRDYVDIDFLKSCVYSINYFTPHTMKGANLNWRSCIKAIMGAFLEDSSYIETAKSGFETVLTYVTSSDGFYESDGSFIQHNYFAYIGSYGANLYKILAKSLVALKDTPWDISEEKKALAIATIKDSVEPLLTNGRIMEIVCGRGVASGTGLAGYSGGAAIINTFPIFASLTEGENADYLKSLAKEMLSHLTSQNVLDLYNYYDETDMGIYLYAKDILENETITPFERTDNARVFYNMDRIVQHNDKYSLGLAIHSTRTGSYEQANANNMRGWYQASGTLFIYNDDYKRYNDRYWYTTDWWRMPGATSLYGIPMTSENGSGSSCGQNPWAGGTELGDYTIASMFMHPADMTLNAKKSYFMFDNEVVALGAGITSSDDAYVETTLDNIKLLDDNSNKLIIDGIPTDIDADGDGLIDTADNAAGLNRLQNAIETTISKYAHISGNTENSAIGYYFPESTTLNIVRENRSGYDKLVNPGSSIDDETPYTKKYLKMFYSHGLNAEDSNSYSYVLLPGASAEETASYSENADIEILSNTEDAQAVYDKKLNMTGITFWNDKETTVMKNDAEWITSNGAASVMVSETDTEITLAVSDPTQLKTEKFCIEINAETNGVAKAHEDISVLQHGKKTIIEINPVSVVGNKGETKTITLTKGEYINQEEIVAPSIEGETIGTKEGTFVSKALNISGSRPLSFSTDCTTEGIEVDRFGKIFVSDSVPIGKYTFNVTVSNDAGSSTAEFTALVLTAVESKTPTGAVAYYDFNDGYGSTATAVSQIKTSSAQNFDGDLSEGVEWVDGFVGTALKFDSIDDTLINDGGTGTNANSIGMQPSQSVFGGATEYDFWVKFDTDPTTRNSDQWIISKGSKSATSNIPWAIKVTKAGKLAFIWNAGAGTANNWKYSDALEWNEGEWYHINITHDSSYNVTFKRDGLTVGSGTTNTGITAINRVTSINSGEYLTANTAQYFNGTIDELYLGKAGGGEEIRLRSKVNFHLDDSDIEPQYIDFNDTVSEPVLTAKTGHLFLGWYTDADCTQKYDFSSPVTTDITLYAKWIDCGKIPTVSVKNRILFYNFNEGYGTAVKTSGTKLSSVTSSMDVNATISSGAEWVQGFVGTAVRFDSLSDSLAMNKASGTNKNAIGMLPSESAFGGGTEYDFWVKLDVHPSKGEQMILARQHTGTTIPWNIKITANGEIGFAYGSNTFVLTEKLGWNVDEWYHINITHSSDFLATISRDGIALGSGTTGKSCIGTSQTMRINSGNYFTSDNYFKGTIDELYLGSMGYAKTAYSRYKYTFNSNGGSDVAVQYLFGDETATEIIPTKDGYTFAGWYTDESLATAYDFSDLASADTTLYAKWEEEQPKPQLGDANQDGAIDTNDLVILRQYLLGTLEIDIDINLLDVASDGKIDLKDLIRYKKYFAHIADIG